MRLCVAPQGADGNACDFGALFLLWASLPTSILGRASTKCIDDLLPSFGGWLLTSAYSYRRPEGAPTPQHSTTAMAALCVSKHLREFSSAQHHLTNLQPASSTGSKDKTLTVLLLLPSIAGLTAASTILHPRTEEYKHTFNCGEAAHIMSMHPSAHNARMSVCYQLLSRLRIKQQITV